MQVTAYYGYSLRRPTASTKWFRYPSALDPDQASVLVTHASKDPQDAYMNPQGPVFGYEVDEWKDLRARGLIKKCTVCQSWTDWSLSPSVADTCNNCNQ